MQILVIGKNGQVARCLKREASKYDYLFTQVSSEEMNLENEKSIKDVLQKYNSEIDHTGRRIIINAAAYTNVEEAEIYAEKAMQINAIAPGIIANFAKEYGYEFVHYSTDYVFDGKKNAPYLEEDETNPINSYGRSKLEGENRIIASGCDYLILRTSWVFSEFGVNFVKKMMDLLQEKEELKVIDDQIGCPSYAGFIAEVTLKLLKLKECNKTIINICQPQKTSWYGFACQIKMELDRQGKKTAIITKTTSEEFQTKAKRPKNSVLSIAKLLNLLPDEKIPNWNESLKKMIEFASNFYNSE